MKSEKLVQHLMNKEEFDALNVATWHAIDEIQYYEDLKTFEHLSLLIHLDKKPIIGDLILDPFRNGYKKDYCIITKEEEPNYSLRNNGNNIFEKHLSRLYYESMYYNSRKKKMEKMRCYYDIPPSFVF